SRRPAIRSCRLKPPGRNERIVTRIPTTRIKPRKNPRTLAVCQELAQLGRRSNVPRVGWGAPDPKHGNEPTRRQVVESPDGKQRGAPTGGGPYEKLPLAASRGYTAMFCNTEGDSQSEIEGVESLLEHRVAGIVFLAFSGESRAMREAVEQRVPVIFVACSGDAGDVVSVDDVQGGKLATEHLIAAGHRRIAYLSVPELEERSDLMRLQGYEDALRAAGLGPPIRISWSPPADQGVVDGEARKLVDVLTGPQRVTGVFASNDFAGIYLQEFADRY